jgi:hypothetical protein
MRFSPLGYSWEYWDDRLRCAHLVECNHLDCRSARGYNWDDGKRKVV